MDDQDARFAAGFQQCQVERVDHGLIQRVVLVRTVQADQEDITVALRLHETPGHETSCALGRAGHWSKSTVTWSVTGWAWQVST